MRTIESEADLADGLARLLKADRRLKPIAKAAGPLPLRRLPAGFEGLARIVVGQQVSVAAAEAIWQRFAAFARPMRAEAIAAATDADLRAAGLSAAKVTTLRAIAAAVADGLDLDGLGSLAGEEAHRRLTLIRGVGPWTADVYLLFCLGHADVFPAGDLALRVAVGEAFGHASPPPIRETAAIAERWSPWRGVAARLFFAYYRARRRREGVIST